VDRRRLPAVRRLRHRHIDRVVIVEVVVAIDLVAEEPRHRVGENHIVAAEEVARVDTTARRTSAVLQEKGGRRSAITAPTAGTASSPSENFGLMASPPTPPLPPSNGQAGRPSKCDEEDAAGGEGGAVSTGCRA
jgi:hypothetical protein